MLSDPSEAADFDQGAAAIAPSERWSAIESWFDWTGDVGAVGAGDADSLEAVVGGRNGAVLEHRSAWDADSRPGTASDLGSGTSGRTAFPGSGSGFEAVLASWSSFDAGSGGSSLDEAAEPAAATGAVHAWIAPDYAVRSSEPAHAAEAGAADWSSSAAETRWTAASAGSAFDSVASPFGRTADPSV